MHITLLGSLKGLDARFWIHQCIANCTKYYSTDNLSRDSFPSILVMWTWVSQVIQSGFTAARISTDSVSWNIYHAGVTILPWGSYPPVGGGEGLCWKSSTSFILRHKSMDCMMYFTNRLRNEKTGLKQETLLVGRFARVYIEMMSGLKHLYSWSASINSFVMILSWYWRAPDGVIISAILFSLFFFHFNSIKQQHNVLFNMGDLSFSRHLLVWKYGTFFHKHSKGPVL